MEVREEAWRTGVTLDSAVVWPLRAMMLGGLVGAMALDTLVSCLHRDEASARRHSHRECSSQYGED